MNFNYKILILYHSGAGSTKTVAQIYYDKLNMYNIDITPISLNYNYSKLEDYDFYIFAFPTYHCEPSKSMMEFINNLPVFALTKRAFIFTTYGLYSGNAVRIFAEKCIEKNIISCGYGEYRAPATDGALLLPKIEFLFRYEKRIGDKITADINMIKDILEGNIKESKVPFFKLYTVLNFPNKVLGKAYKHRILINKEQCIRCNKCINNCIRGCLNNAKGYPEFDVSNCEFCFRCIHHCPTEAIILSNKTRSRPKLNEEYYKGLKEKILSKA